MTVIGVGARSALLARSLSDMRAQLDDLHRQLGTGKKSDSFAGLGLDRGLTVSLRAQLASLTSFQGTSTNIGPRLGIAQQVLGQIDASAHLVKGAAVRPAFVIDQTGTTNDQQTALGQLDLIINGLNTRVGERYIFSGSATDRPATEGVAQILDGSGGRAGFRQVAAERRLADLGANGLGRLTLPIPLASSVTLSEDVVGSPFGFKLSTATSGLSGAVVTGPAGAPAAIDVDFAAATLNEGETFKLSFNLPDGTLAQIALAATTSTTPAPGQFEIGATAADTATNFQAALSNAIGKLAATSLTAASAFAAANDFFNVDAANPPRRVAGPPFDTATALVAGTGANTVSWYSGEAGAGSARQTSLARIDGSITVAYGMRANEAALRATVANVAVFATMTFATGDANAQARYEALRQRLAVNLDVAPGQQGIPDIEADIANAQTTIRSVDERHVQAKSALEALLDHVEGVPAEEVGAKLLALQTRLQASLQTTAILTRLSIVNFL